MSGAGKHDDDAQTPAPSSVAEAKSGLLDELLAREDAGAGASASLAGRIVSGPAPDAAAAPFGTRVGRLIAWPAAGGPQVEFPGNPRGPVAARSVVALTRELVAELIDEGRGVLLSFEDGRPDAPIITGILQPLEHEDASEPAPELEFEPSDARLDASVDGKRVEISAADEIVLRCGEASIVMRRNGRVVIRGTYVETRSRGVNRVKGGSVEIN